MEDWGEEKGYNVGVGWMVPDIAHLCSGLLLADGDWDETVRGIEDAAWVV